MTDSNESARPGDPPALVNTMVKVMLRTPILQNAIGKQLALVSFTGRRSGKRYTIPMSYHRSGNSVLMLTRKTRSWWRNFADEPQVELRLAGEIVTGTAEAHVGTEDDLAAVVEFLTARPRDAKAHGVDALPDGSPDPESIRALLPRDVIVHVDLD